MLRQAERETGGFRDLIHTSCREPSNVLTKCRSSDGLDAIQIGGAIFEQAIFDTEPNVCRRTPNGTRNRHNREAVQERQG
jgi:hypothetical protein